MRQYGQSRLCRATSAAVLWMLAAVLMPGSSIAQQPTFRRHDLNPQSAYCACAAIDVNHDGKLDVVSGGHWYEAPTWSSHFLREVEVIRGRFDDYSNLPMDVNGDGWMDLVSANYRSEVLYWIEHPGAGVGPWTAHVVDKPGPMETARLYDIDGDGRLDVLPNGSTFAAWWEVATEETATGTAPGNRAPRWIRHDLPAEAAGHGIGFGDVNGDGRGDIVTPRGWLEAPPDRRAGPWRWHPDFELHRDASIPILVLDADGDGDNDLFWGRGHSTGLYWLEQQRPEGAGAPRWQLHAIDTSWSQGHAPMLADVDNDGLAEVVVGKRYLGHEGRDLGEYDPLVIYWYDFDRAGRTWHRHTISANGVAGMGLDPKAIDLDADGDVDILAPGRSGLYWFENLLVRAPDSAPATAEPAPPEHAYADHRELLVYFDRAGAQQAVKTPAQWAMRRADVLAGLQRIMGDLPEPSHRVPLDVQIVDRQETPEYVRTRLTYAAEPGDRVPAYLLVPRKVQGKAPAMLCLHQTTAIGKDEPAGLGGQPNLRYADELAREGFVCLVPDYPSFGEYTYDFRQHRDVYASGSMKAIWNNIRAVDLLESLAEVDRDRIGVIGHSLGGHNAIFTAVFDQRLRAVVSSCGLTAWEDYYGGNLAGWTSDRYMPRIRDMYGNEPKRLPVSFREIVAALAPRAAFLSAPLRDDNFEVGGVKKVVGAAWGVYALYGVKDQLRAEYPDCAHDFPEATRRQAYQWLRERLK